MAETAGPCSSRSDLATVHIDIMGLDPVGVILVKVGMSLIADAFPAVVPVDTRIVTAARRRTRPPTRAACP